MATVRNREGSRAKQLARLIQRRMRRRMLAAFTSIALIVVAIAIPLIIVPTAVRWLQRLRGEAELALRAPKKESALEFPSDGSTGFVIPKERWQEIGMQTIQIVPAPSAKQITMDGILYLDPEDYVAVRSRFAGEFVNVAEIPDTNLPGNASQRSIRFGDEVKKGQVLGTAWSRELGEKKSELAQHVSSLQFDRETLARLSTVQTSVPASQIREAERRVRDSEISVERIEKTLRSWQLSPEEIQSILDEIAADKGKTISPNTLSKSKIDNWARVEIRSPIDGTIVEKNVTVGAMVDQDDILFKVANLDHLDVRAFAYEEDIVTIQNLPKNQRSWKIQLKSDSNSVPILGVFDRIGGLIDPVQHTGLVMGWVDNSQRMLRPGQFVTASIVIPDPEPLVAVPSSAIVEYDGKSYVLVTDVGSTDRFHSVEVKIERYQMKDACLRFATKSEEIPVLKESMQVIATAAMEIFAEYQSYLASRGPTDGRTDISMGFDRTRLTSGRME